MFLQKENDFDYTCVPVIMYTLLKYHVSFRTKTWYPHAWKENRFYGSIINRTFRRKKYNQAKWFEFN